MTNDDLARQRFFVLNAIRLMSTAMLIVGLLILAGKIAMPRVAGGVFAALGLLELVLLPLFLARKWKSPGK